MSKRRGSVSVEYLIIAALVAMALLNGNPSPLERMVDAFRETYARFTNAMSQL